MKYDNQIRYKEIGEKGQKDLQGKTVTIVGIGGVGSTVAEILTRAGVNLRLIDKERIYPEELSRLALFSPEHVEKFKAKEAKKIIETINPDIKLKTFHEELVPHNTFLLEGDCVLDCTNETKANTIINQSCKRPLIVCRYAGDRGIIFHKSTKHNILKLKTEVEKLSTIESLGIFNPTTHIAAAVIAAEAMKILLKKKQITDLIMFDSWEYTIKLKK